MENLRANQGVRTAQNKKRSKAKSPQQQEKNAALVKQAHQEYRTVAQQYLGKARQTLVLMQSQGFADALDGVARALGMKLHAEAA